jgi:hypothetical protein
VTRWWLIGLRPFRLRSPREKRRSLSVMPKPALLGRPNRATGPRNGHRLILSLHPGPGLGKYLLHMNEPRA